MLGSCGSQAAAPAPAPSEGAGASVRRALGCQYDMLNVQRARLTVLRADVPGALAARAALAAGDGNGYARGVRRVAWRSGQTVRYAVSLLLPSGFREQVQGQVDLLRWDNWPDAGNAADWGGVAIWGGDRRARLLRFRRGEPEDVLIGPFTLPEGRWFRLGVVQRLGGGRAASEVYIDGRRIGRSLAPNTYDRPLQRVRFGLVAIDARRQERPLQLDFAAPQATPARTRRCR
jgi:hypothetical protein